MTISISILEKSNEPSGHLPDDQHQKNIGFTVRTHSLFSQQCFQSPRIVNAMFATKKTPTRRRSSLIHRRSRSGAAVVEAALCIPVIILLMFGTLEISAGFYLKESLTIAAYEGARTGAKRRATRAQVLARVNDILVARNVQLGSSGSIVVTPNDLSTLSALQPLTVTVRAPTTGNSALIFDSIANRNVTATVRMAREFDH